MVPAYVATTDTKALNSLDISSDDGNVAISVHAYSPYFFTMDTGTYSNHEFPGKSGYGEDYDSSLKSLFNSLKSVSENKGVPIIIGEFSASDFNNTESRVEWAKAYLGYAKEANIPCVLWDNNVCYNEKTGDNGEAHGYFYRLTNTVYPNSAEVLKAMMDTVGVTDYVLPEYKEYEAPTFDWDDIPVADDWKEIYKSEDGTVLDSWDNIAVSGWKDYINEDYKLALVYDSSSDVEIVLQGGWYRIPSTSNDTFVAYFEYDDIMDILNSNDVTLAEMKNLFISATVGSATMYGLYAVPISSSEVTTTTTATDTDTSETLWGDANCDGKINVVDIQLMRQYILHMTESGTETYTTQGYLNSDVNHDGDVRVTDLILVKRYVLHLIDTLG
jgi:hypothetical protein